MRPLATHTSGSISKNGKIRKGWGLFKAEVFILLAIFISILLEPKEISSILIRLNV